MVFSSPLFIFLFLPITLLGYFLIRSPYRNTFLLIASLIFYAWGETFLVMVLIVSLVANYHLTLFIDSSLRKHSASRPSRRPSLWLSAAIVCNLLPLFYFKYANFLAFNLISVFGSQWLTRGWKEIALPIGISFYTFQAMSYVVDVYRRETPVARNFIDFACYVTCFPQLIAGPIVRYKDISRQLIDRIVSIEKFYNGAQWFIIGLSKKVLIANVIGKTADSVFSLPADQLNISHAWLGIICYTLQIYYDFSGYTDMAIGLGLILGFHFPQNFNYPYIARSVRGFWHRWHISLSTWFRDYLYIPLGGNKGRRWRTYLNLWIVFLLCGLWHGASWDFVIWGAFHGLFLVLERGRFGELVALLPVTAKHIYTLLVVVIGWVVFRSDTITYAAKYLAIMFGISDGLLPIEDHQIFTIGNDTILALTLGIVFSVPLSGIIEHIPFRPKRMQIAMLYLSLLFVCLTSLVSNTYNPFLYFRF
jgi:alginate O-acetyltransferase complex protein AlgI